MYTIKTKGSQKKKRKKERKKKKILHKLTKVNQIVPVSFAKDHAHISMH